MNDDERRSVARYQPRRGSIFIGWTGPSGFVSTRGEILNISLGGAAISVAGFPAGLRAASIRLIGDDNGYPDWVSVSVLETRNLPDGAQQRIRMKFDGFCPYDFFKAILVASAASDGDAPSESRADGEPPPSPRAATLPRVAALPSAGTLARQQPEPAPVAPNTPVPGNHLRSALSARESGRASNLRGPSRIPGR
jgi:hypothetical protein